MGVAPNTLGRLSANKKLANYKEIILNLIYNLILIKGIIDINKILC